jgi:hypothetical protein
VTDFLMAVCRMRVRQKEYFRTRDKSPGGALEQSKAAELLVDNMIASIANSKQPDLFSRRENDGD